jgi:hypothetical protein
MKELIEEGFEPETINGEIYSGEQDYKDAVTATKPSFTIQIDPESELNPDPFTREVFYTDENGYKYYFVKQCSYRYHIVTSERVYSLTEALEIYTIDELINAGLDCKKSQL